MNRPPPLVALGITKRYGSLLVLDGIDLHVGAGETVALLGPNGAGKSTLLGCIAGTVIPDIGRISIAGHDLHRAPIAAREALRYVAQELDPPLGLTGRDVLDLLTGVHRAELDSERAIALAGLGEALERLVSTYSVGMRKRLALAALVIGPSALLVLDEPFAGLDREARERTVDAVCHAAASGSGIVLAAHDRDEAELAALSARAVTLAGPGRRDP